MTAKLNGGDQFPHMTIPLHGSGELSLPQKQDTGYQVVLFYRGSF